MQTSYVAIDKIPSKQAMQTSYVAIDKIPIKQAMQTSYAVQQQRRWSNRGYNSSGNSDTILPHTQTQ